MGREPLDEAASIGPTDQGRFHIGAGLHAIEDYFSHSNFIEVALNSFIDELLPKKRSKQSAGIQSFLKQVEKDEKASGGVRSQQKLGGKATHVDTLFDATAAKGKRQAVTTGSVSGIDMKGSIGHILLPKAPLLQKAIDESIEKIFGLVVDHPTRSAPGRRSRRPRCRTARWPRWSRSARVATRPA